MRLLVSLLLVVGLLFGNSGFEKEKKREKISYVKLSTMLKGNHKSSILGIGFYKNEKMFTLSSDGELKTWDIEEQDLLKTVYLGSGIKKVEFAKDGKTIYILKNSVFTIYNMVTKKSKNIKITNGIDMQIISNNEVIILSRSFLSKFNLLTGEAIYQSYMEKSIFKGLTISKNQKYIAIYITKEYHNRERGYFHYTPYYIKVYRMKTGEYISKLPGNFDGLNRIYFLDNKNIGVLSTIDKVFYFQIYNFKTSEQQKMKKDVKIPESILMLENNYLEINNKEAVIKLVDKKILKEIRRAKIDGSTVSFNGIKLSDDKSLLAIGFKSGDVKLYNSKKLFPNSPKVVEKVNVAKAEKAKIAKEKAKKAKVEKVRIAKEEAEKAKAEKARIAKEEAEKAKAEKARIAKEKAEKERIRKSKINKAPTLTLEASTTEGVIPLRVDFTILASDDKKVTSYYINLAGKESMKNGTPPMMITKTFNRAGKYKVFVAVKDAEGEITTKSIIISPREETFSDYKKRYQ